MIDCEVAEKEWHMFNGVPNEPTLVACLYNLLMENGHCVTVGEVFSIHEPTGSNPGRRVNISPDIAVYHVGQDGSWRIAIFIEVKYRMKEEELKKSLQWKTYSLQGVEMLSCCGHMEMIPTVEKVERIFKKNKYLRGGIKTYSKVTSATR